MSINTRREKTFEPKLYLEVIFLNAKWLIKETTEFTKPDKHHGRNGTLINLYLEITGLIKAIILLKSLNWKKKVQNKNIGKKKRILNKISFKKILNKTLQPTLMVLTPFQC